MVLLAFLIVALCGNTVNSEKLRCRACDKVSTLNDCHTILECEDYEECYMDEIITSNGIFYKGGCRSRELCMVARKRAVDMYEDQTPIARSRRVEELLSCSRCCTLRTNTSDIPCNDRLCGIMRTAGSSGDLECYKCNDVDDYHKCNTAGTCSDDEVCSAKAVLYTDNSIRYSFGCSRIHPCRDGTGILISGGNVVGKREHLQACQICCGDNLCNTGPCKDLADIKRRNVLIRYPVHIPVHIPNNTVSGSETYRTRCSGNIKYTSLSLTVKLKLFCF